MGIETNSTGAVFLSTPYEKAGGANNWDQHTVTVTLSEPTLSGYLEINLDTMQMWATLDNFDGTEILIISDAATEHVVTATKSYEPFDGIVNTTQADDFPATTYPFNDPGTFSTVPYGSAMSPDGVWYVSHSTTNVFTYNSVASSYAGGGVATVLTLAIPGAPFSSALNACSWSPDGTYFFGLDYNYSGGGLCKFSLVTPSLGLGGGVNLMSSGKYIDGLGAPIIGTSTSTYQGIGISADQTYFAYCTGGDNKVHRVNMTTAGDPSALTYRDVASLTEFGIVRDCRPSPDSSRLLVTHYTTSLGYVSLVEFDDPNDWSAGHIVLGSAQTASETGLFGCDVSQNGERLAIFGQSEDCFSPWYLGAGNGIWRNTFTYALTGTPPAVVAEMYRNMNVPTVKIPAADVIGNLDHTLATAITPSNIPGLFTRSGGVASKIIDYPATVIDAGAVQFKFESTGPTHISNISIDLQVGA